MTAFKNILKIITALVIATSVLAIFFLFTLPAIKQDREQMKEQEMEVHNQTLEMIKQDFSYVLSTENVSVQMDKAINLTISGEHCDLKVSLNRELKVLSLETVDNTEFKLVGLVFACILEGLALLLAVGWFMCTIVDVIGDIRFAIDTKRARKNLKKQSVDVEVIV